MPTAFSFVPVAVPVCGWLLASLVIFAIHYMACWRRRAHLVGHLSQVRDVLSSRVGWVG